jgi:Flp pilus assembly pilin Flp
MKRRATALGRLFVRIWRDEEGGESIEYAMTLGFLALGGYALVKSVGGKVVEMWHQIDTALSALN